MAAVMDYLPWVSLIAGALGFFFRSTPVSPLVRRVGTDLIFPVVCMASLWALAHYVDGETRRALFFGMAGVGCATLLDLLSRWANLSFVGEAILALGIAAFAVSNRIDVVELATTATFGGLVAGLVMGSLRGLFAQSRCGALTALFVFLAGILTLLTRVGYREQLHNVAPLLCLLTIVALLVSFAVHQALSKQSDWMPKSLAVLCFAGLCWTALAYHFGESDLAVVSFAAVALAVVSHWTFRSDGSSALPWGIVVLGWFLVGTLAFSLAFGLGVAVAALAGIGALLVLNRLDLLPAAYVLASLGLYRIFRETYPNVVQPFDIGQHYGLVGFMLGVLIVFSVSETLRSKVQGFGFAISAGRHLVALAMLGVVLFAVSFLGSKGAIGLLFGIGVGPALSVATIRKSWPIVVGGLGLQCAVLTAYDPLILHVTLTKDEKTRLLLWLVGGLVVIAVATYFAFRIGDVHENEEQPA